MLLLGRDPVTGERLASQPTLSRFENGVGRGALYRVGRELAESVIERHRQRRRGRARRITIDLDPTARGATADLSRVAVREPDDRGRIAVVANDPG